MAVFFVLTACSGRPQMDAEDCYGIYCSSSDENNESDDYGSGEEDQPEEEGGEVNVTSPLARQSLFYRTRPSFRVV